MKEILIASIPYIAPVIIGALGWLGKKLADLLTASVKNKTLAGVLSRLDYSVVHAVQFVAQTFVDDIRAAAADGNVSPEELKAARDKAIAAAKTFLGPKGLEELASVFGLDPGKVDEWLGMRVESAVRSLKSADTVAPPGGVAPAPLPAARPVLPSPPPRP